MVVEVTGEDEDPTVEELIPMKTPSEVDGMWLFSIVIERHSNKVSWVEITDEARDEVTECFFNSLKESGYSDAVYTLYQCRADAALHEQVSDEDERGLAANKAKVLAEMAAGQGQGQLSRFEVEERAIASRILRLEEANLAPRSWELQGEVSINEFMHPHTRRGKEPRTRCCRRAWTSTSRTS